MDHLSNPDQAPGNGHPQTRRARAAAASECVGGGDALLKPLRHIEASIHFLSVEPLLAPMVPGLDLAGNDWVIGGGESPGRLRARPCDPDWMRALRDLCIARGVPFFLKQWGAWQNNPTPRDQELDPKAHGGATLDGRLWREFPV